MAKAKGARSTKPHDLQSAIVAHPLLQPAPGAETLHLLLKSGEAACAMNPELSPGHDCCALCARPRRCVCPRCGKVAYCGPAHAAEDEAQHGQVCRLLAALAASEALDVPHDLQEALLERVVEAAAQQESGGDEGGGVPALRSSRGWARAVPEVLLPVIAPHIGPGRADPVTSSDEAPPEEQHPHKPKGRQAKRQRQDSLSGDAAPPSGGAALQGATLVAVLTSYLSYPLTLAQALTQQGTGPGGGALARAVAAALPPAPSRGAPQEGPGREGRGQAGASAGPGGAPASGADVVVTVLGASEGAELAHLDVWKLLDVLVVAPLCRQLQRQEVRLVLQMVGPEVPLLRHLQAVRLTPRLTLAFFKGEFSALVEHQLATSGGAPGQPQQQQQQQQEEVPGALLALPHALVGFNMGLTCQDYSWAPTLKAIRRLHQAKRSRAAGGGQAAVTLPLLHTTNTLVEAAMEAEELQRAGGWRIAAPPSTNPWASLDPLQSGTLGNDVYRKNAYHAVALL